MGHFSKSAQLGAAMQKIIATKNMKDLQTCDWNTMTGKSRVWLVLLCALVSLITDATCWFIFNSLARLLSQWLPDKCLLAR